MDSNDQKSKKQNDSAEPLVEETAAIDEAQEEIDVMQPEPSEEPAAAEPETEVKAEVETPVAEPESPEEAPTEVKTPEVERPLDEEAAKQAERMEAVNDDKGRWYIIHTYSGHEDKVAKSLKQRVESMGFANKIFDIIVPTRNTIKVSQGKKESVKEKIFPGYVLVKMILDDESWLLVRTTPGVTAFIGAGNKPTPISEKEVQAIQKFMKMEEPLYKASFSTGQPVKIVDGPFADFLGSIESIDEARGKLKVLVTIFGRETPVELDFLQVAKI